MSLFDKKNTIDIPEYKHYSYLRLASFLIIGFIGAVIIGGIFFVYNNIYTAIGQTQAFINLDQNLSIEIIDFTKYDRVDKLWKEKYSEKELVLTRDPFNAVIKEVLEEDTE
ncbi:MAG: hypothetical protein HOA57_04770 [Candidatus Magasanikbacteria bacterium]|jgi:hypothetical protein|nr:hypothetical protein [Candidatus Magasanikbacteria bacterium]MBT4314877.1 hypothetical protein [Candidatus Magasanikbacteria bacterium]MBT4546736.1 hypothetical protein [Candidatus Magasanikbacteria bacterium]MBT6819655.1 hypothetical protein [Candidatus Magasanikbacteria bacterium]